MKLLNRLRELEAARSNDDDPVILFSTYDVAAAGWYFNDAQGKHCEIMRKPGESDAALEKRAADAAQAARPGLFCWLNQIDETSGESAHGNN